MMRKKILFLCFLMFSLVYSSNKDSFFVKKILRDSVFAINHVANSSSFNYGLKSEFTEEYIAENYPSYNEGDPAEEAIAKAKEVIARIDEMNNYTGKVDKSKFTTLPIGVKKNFGDNVTAVLAISSVKFYPTYSEVVAFVRITLPETDMNGQQRQLFFGTTDLKISHDGGIVGNGDIALLGDYSIPINGDKMLLSFLGGFDMSTGESQNKTFVTVDCEGIKEISITAELSFSRSLLTPLDKDYKPITDKKKKVKAYFHTSATGWNDIKGDINIPPFQIANPKREKEGKSGFGFQVKTAVFDMSDLQNPASINFPKDYEKNFMISGQENLWRGVYIKTLSFILPKHFKEKGSDKRRSFEAKDIIIDNNGVSGIVKAKNIIPIDKGVVSKWQFSLDYMKVAFIANKFANAGFGGHVVMPVSKKVESKDILPVDPPKDFDSEELNPNIQESTSSKEVTTGYGKSMVEKQEEETPEQKEKREKNGKRGAIEYTALFKRGWDYDLVLKITETLNFDVFKAELKLDENSKIELKNIDDELKPKAVLSGLINFRLTPENGVNDPLAKATDFEGIKFEKMIIQSEYPKFQADYIGYEKSVEMLGFPITINKFGISANKEKVSLHMGFDVNLMDGGFKAGSTFELVGKYEDFDGYGKWKYDQIKFSEFTLGGGIGGCKLEGKLNIKKEDPIYGDGFHGEVKLTTPTKITIKSTALFGKKSFRYFYVDGLVSIPRASRPKIGPVEFTSIGGGLSYRMTRDENPKKQYFEGKEVVIPKPPSALDFVPDIDAGLGFRLLTNFQTVGVSSTFNGQANFGIIFTESFGLDQIYLNGEAHMMKKIKFDGFGSMTDKLKKVVKKARSATKNPATKALRKTNLLKYSKEAFPADGLKFDTGIDAFLAMEYDHENSSFHAALDSYINSTGNVISGVGERGRAGLIVFHVDKDKWYLHLGYPEYPDDYNTSADDFTKDVVGQEGQQFEGDIKEPVGKPGPIGVRIGVGAFSLSAKAYFLLGYDIPPIPPPPMEVANALKIEDYGEIDMNRINGDLQDMRSATGLALGMHFAFDTGDMTFLMFYARLKAGLGFDLMMRSTGGTHCKGGYALGYNGWYSSGQAYAYVSGRLGIKVSLPFLPSQKIDILGAGAAILLQASLPSPVWLRGFVAADYSVLGGLVSGECRFKFEYGERCEPTDGSLPPELHIISQLSPEDSEEEVDVYIKPQAAFNIKVDHPFEVRNENGSVTVYKAHLEEFSLMKDNNEAVPGEVEWKSSKDVVNFVPTEILESQSTYRFNVSVSFQRKQGSEYVTMRKTNGEKALETRNIIFKTGDRPETIMPHNVQYTYPVIDQKYFFKKEYDYGYIKLESGREDLFNKTGWKQDLVFTSLKTDLSTEPIPVSYDVSDKLIKFEIPKGDLDNSEPYKIQIFNRAPEGIANENGTVYQTTTSENGTTVTIKNKQAQKEINGAAEDVEIFTYNFATSYYNTFKQKLDNRNPTANFIEVQNQSALVHYLHLENKSDERFEQLELEGSEYTMNEPLIEKEALLNDSYYKNTIKPLIYDNYPLNDEFSIPDSGFRDIENIGIPPSKGVDLTDAYVYLLTNENHNTYLDTRFPFVYSLAGYYYYDFTALRAMFLNKYTHQNIENNPEYLSIYNKYSHLFDSKFPALQYGTYEVRFTYLLPGKIGNDRIKGTSSVIKYRFNK